MKAVKYYHLSLDQNKELCQAYNNIAVAYLVQKRQSPALKVSIVGGKQWFSARFWYKFLVVSV